ncbi:MAG: Fur family zinc uptake transcriptional regulator [Francisellaceae bacterium]|jgi:Fur family zinc uptake transcriptional regulator
MPSIDEMVSQAEKNCSDSGVKLTDKRKQVLACLLESDIALSAYEIIDVLHHKHQTNIQAMSIYRILDFLQKENLVHKLQLMNKYIACSHITCSHEHQLSQFLICGKCGLVKEIMISKALINNLKITIEDAGYFFSSHQLELSCLCKNCAED